MRSYFTNLLTSAWATKSEYFVLVGFLFGVVIAYLFSVPDVWAFTIGLAQIVGGFGVILAVGVAVWQINEFKAQATEEARIAKEQADELVVRQENLAAIRIYDALARHFPVVGTMGEFLLDALFDPDICWEAGDHAPQWKSGKEYIVIQADPKGVVRSRFPVLVDMLPNEIVSSDDAILLFPRSPQILERLRDLQASISLLKEYYAIGEELLDAEEEYLSGPTSSFVQTMLYVGAQIIAELSIKYPHVLHQTEYPPFPWKSWKEFVWSDTKNVLKLASENPPYDWGDWEDAAKIIWKADGGPSKLPVKKRVIG